MSTLMPILSASAWMPSRMVCQNWLERTFRTTAYSALPSAAEALSAGAASVLEASAAGWEGWAGVDPQAARLRPIAIAKRIAMIFFIEFPPNMLSRPGRGGKCRKRVIVFSLHPKYNISPVECQPRGINFIDLMGNRLLILCKLPGLITKA